MTLLVDNHLPLALARYLAANGWECTHVGIQGQTTILFEGGENNRGTPPIIPGG